MDFTFETIVLIGVFIGQIATVVVAVRNPNEKQDVSIGGLKIKVESMEDRLSTIQTNHLSHIEADVKIHSERLARIEAILEERLPRRK